MSSISNTDPPPQALVCSAVSVSQIIIFLKASQQFYQKVTSNAPLVSAFALITATPPNHRPEPTNISVGGGGGVLCTNRNMIDTSCPDWLVRWFVLSFYTPWVVTKRQKILPLCRSIHPAYSSVCPSLPSCSSVPSCHVMSSIHPSRGGLGVVLYTGTNPQKGSSFSRYPYPRSTCCTLVSLAKQILIIKITWLNKKGI